MDTHFWLIGLFFSVTIWSHGTDGASNTLNKMLRCNVCTPENARHIGRDETYMAKGCNDPIARNKTQSCAGTLCYWSILIDSRPEEVLQKNGKRVNVTKQAGWMSSKGCEQRATFDRRAGTCEVMKHQGQWKQFQCYCKNSMCNMGLPPCKWMRKAADPSNKKPQGCFDKNNTTKKVGPAAPQQPSKVNLPSKVGSTWKPTDKGKEKETNNKNNSSTNVKGNSTGNANTTVIITNEIVNNANDTDNEKEVNHSNEFQDSSEEEGNLSETENTTESNNLNEVENTTKNEIVNEVENTTENEIVNEVENTTKGASPPKYGVNKKKPTMPTNNQKAKEIKIFHE